jgi:hypothetical protein
VNQTGGGRERMEEGEVKGENFEVENNINWVSVSFRLSGTIIFIFYSRNFSYFKHLRTFATHFLLALVLS